MLVNRDHRPWALGTAVLTGGAIAAYAALSLRRPYGPSGGSPEGLAFGIASAAGMVVLALLPLRRRLRTRRGLGSARQWMAAHLWVGIGIVPLTLLHAGFSLGGPLTTVLAALFAGVTASGLWGLAVQQIVPRLITERVGREAPIGQHDHLGAVRGARAYELVAAFTGTLPEAADEQATLKALAEGAQAWKQPEPLEPAEEPAPEATRLRAFYLQAVRPYVRGGGRLAPPDFETFEATAEPEWLAAAEELRTICDEVRQMREHRRLHGWLHDWLLVHVPLAFALIVLVAVHAWFALQY